eukprot:XP_001700335.1 predicted protein [Chlamydomonas reinhardtii]
MTYLILEVLGSPAALVAAVLAILVSALLLDRTLLREWLYDFVYCWHRSTKDTCKDSGVGASSSTDCSLAQQELLALDPAAFTEHLRALVAAVTAAAEADDHARLGATLGALLEHGFEVGAGWGRLPATWTPCATGGAAAASGISSHGKQAAEAPGAGVGAEVPTELGTVLSLPAPGDEEAKQWRALGTACLQASWMLAAVVAALGGVVSVGGLSADGMSPCEALLRQAVAEHALRRQLLRLLLGGCGGGEARITVLSSAPGSSFASLISALAGPGGAPAAGCSGDSAQAAPLGAACGVLAAAGFGPDSWGAASAVPAGGALRGSGVDHYDSMSESSSSASASLQTRVGRGFVAAAADDDDDSSSAAGPDAAPALHTASAAAGELWGHEMLPAPREAAAEAAAAGAAAGEGAGGEVEDGYSLAARRFEFDTCDDADLWLDPWLTPGDTGTSPAVEAEQPRHWAASATAPETTHAMRGRAAAGRGGGLWTSC